MRPIVIGKFIIAVISVAVVVALFFIGIIYFATRNPPYDDIKKEMVIGSNLTEQNTGFSRWNPHTLLDWAFFSIGSRLYSHKGYFVDGVTTREFKDHLEGVHVELPRNLKEGMYELEADTPEGKMYPAFRVYHWHSDTAPTVIYNHGASQVPFDAIFVSIFDQNTIQHPLKVNLIVVRTPYHRFSRAELVDASSTLSRFLSILAVSVGVTEKLVQSVRENGSQIVEVAGTSNGGFVANLHHLAYNSATYYVPIVAGTAYAEVFIKTNGIHPSARVHTDILRKHLNFTDLWEKADNNNVFPILGRYDYANALKQQGPSYKRTTVEVWDTGHITTATSVRALRHALLRHVVSKEELESL